MARVLGRFGALLLAFAAATVKGQYEDLDFEDMMGDMYGQGYGGMGDMDGMGGMGGMGDMMGMMGGGMGYGGYGYGESAPAHTELVDMADVDKFISGDPLTPCVIAFYNDDTHVDEIMAFRTTASRMEQRGVRFGVASEDDVLEHMKYTAGRVMAYPPKRFLVEGDRPKHRYPAATLDPEPLSMWIAKVVTPLVGPFNWETAILYQDIGLPELTAFFKDAEEGEYDEIAAVLRRVAKSRPKKELSYVTGDVETLSSMVPFFHFSVEAMEGTAVGIRNENAFYRMDKPFGEEAIAEFVEAYLQGTVKPVHVEEEEEDDGDLSDGGMDNGGGGGGAEEDGRVVVLTPSNFEEVVEEEGKDVMVEFYAPWCGHCKALQPVYAEVAAEVADMPSVVVAKMDADAHTPPAEYPLTSYPTILFLKAGEKSTPIPYSGPREKDAMVAFIRENASPPVIAAA